MIDYSAREGEGRGGIYHCLRSSPAGLSQLRSGEKLMVMSWANSGLRIGCLGLGLGMGTGMDMDMEELGMGMGKAKAKRGRDNQFIVRESMGIGGESRRGRRGGGTLNV